MSLSDWQKKVQMLKQQKAAAIATSAPTPVSVVPAPAAPAATTAVAKTSPSPPPPSQQSPPPSPPPPAAPIAAPAAPAIVVETPQQPAAPAAQPAAAVEPSHTRTGSNSSREAILQRTTVWGRGAPAEGEATAAAAHPPTAAPTAAAPAAATHSRSMSSAATTAASREAILQRTTGWGRGATGQPPPPSSAAVGSAQALSHGHPMRPSNPPPSKTSVPATATPASSAAAGGKQSAEDIRRKAQMWTANPVGTPGGAPAQSTAPASGSLLIRPSGSVPGMGGQLKVPGMGPPGMGGAPKGPGGRAMTDKEIWRQSRRMVRQSRMFATNQLSSILENVTLLERTIAAVEAARQLAEENVIEIAVAKMEEDERVIQIAERLSGVIDHLDVLSPGELRTQLTEVRDSLISNVPKGTAGSSPAAATPAAPVAAQAAPEAGSSAIPAPPPPPPMPGITPLAPTPGKVALLEQIRTGQKLRKTDVDRLKMEQRRQWKQEGRKSVMMVKSLEETIRSALQSKFSFGAAPEDEGDDDEDDAEWV